MFVKKPLRDQLICFAHFVGMFPLAVHFLPKYCLKVCFSTLFAAVLKFFLPITTFAISGAANSNKSPPAAGTIYSSKKGKTVLSKTCARAPSPHAYCQPMPLLVLKQPSCKVFRLEMNAGVFSKQQNKMGDTDSCKGYFFYRSCLSKQCEYFEKNV